MKHFIFLLVVLTLSVELRGQRLELPDSAEGFGKAVDAMFSFSSSILQDSTSTSTALGFEGLWATGLDQSQKEIILATSHRLLRKKNLNSRSALKTYFDNLVIASDHPEVPATEFADLIEISQKVVEAYNATRIRSYLTLLNEFLKYRTLYFSNYNRVYIAEGEFQFEFIEPPIPEIAQEEFQEEEDEFVDEAEIAQMDLDADDGWGANSGGGWGSEDGGEGWGNEGWGNDDSGDLGSSWEEEDSFEEDSENEASTDELFLIEDEVIYTPPEVILPEIVGPILGIQNATLIIVTPYDSALIVGTSGSFMFTRNLFLGEGGRTDWVPAGLNSDSVYADLESYYFDISRPRFSAENASLYYYGKLNGPIKGSFRFSSVKRESYVKARYPQFQSYFNDIEYADVGDPKLSLTGGFTLIGDELSTASANQGLSTIVAIDSGRVKFVANALNYFFQDSLLRSNRSTIVIHHYADSIYHPAMKFNYHLRSSLLRMVRDHSGYKYTPFSTSFFKMEINAGLLDWDITTDSLNISVLNARNQVPVIFESEEYFNEVRFNSLSALYPFNPLLMAVGYSRKIGSLHFHSFDMAGNLNQKPNQVRSAMIDLKHHGYIDYNPETDLVGIKRKAVHYVLAKWRKRDYDNLLMASVSPALPNATFFLETQEMKVRGIERFTISDVLGVYIEPENSEVKLQSNRDFEFDGAVNAGNFRYIGKNFRFDYDSFLVVLPQVDSIKLQIDAEDEDGKDNINNQLVETGGVLYINKPDNKSALKSYAQYPIYEASIGAIVYFDNNQILDGAYDHTIYFSVPPFTIDSVSSSDPSAIGFEGTFHSGGIFPDFQQTLNVMPDNSLGFVHQLPPEGFEVYGGQGQLFSDLKLDGNGLRANGEITYSSSVVKSPEFVFFMDSVVAIGTEAVIEEKRLPDMDFPDATVEQFKMQWLPYQDSMYISNLEEPFKLYKESATLDGTAIVSSHGLYGQGEFVTRGSETNSLDMRLKNDGFRARHAGFEIKSDNPGKPVLSAEDVKVDLSLVDGLAHINPEVEGVAALNFPYAQFRTSIPNATWDLTEETITMKKTSDVDIGNSYFYTTREDLDSLSFNATGALYNISELTLQVSGIPYIIVADAKITPYGGEVMILENAQLQELENATLVIDTLNEYHNLFDGDISIISRNKFEGSATYQYVNAMEDTFAIKMGEFQLVAEEIERGSRFEEPPLHTVSSGQIGADQNLIISPGMIFKGTMTMTANKEVLDLDGAVKLDLQNIENYDTWIQYESAADVQEVIIPFNESVTENGDPLTAGVHFDQDYSLYGTFITDRRSPDDEDFFIPSGQLFHDVNNDNYKIIDFYKSTGESFAGKSFVYNEVTSDISFEGGLNFLTSTNKVSIQASGSGTGNLNNSELELNAFLSINFDLYSQALDVMATDVAQTVERLGLVEAESDKTALLYKVAEIVGDRPAKDYEVRSLETYTPLASISPNLIRSMVISSVDLKWSDEYKTFYSASKIGVSNVKRTDINAKIDGFVEIKKSYEGESVNVFLQVTPATWYYFGFEENRLVLFSSNTEFNGLIASKSNLSKAGIGEYVYMLGDLQETLYFINRFRNLYYDIEEPYELEEPQEAAPQAFETFEVSEDSNRRSKKEKKAKEDKQDDFVPFGVEEEESNDKDDEDGF